LLQILKTVKPGTSVSWEKLNKYMKGAGVPQFEYETFKTEYDNNPQLQDLVKFDPEGVTINKDAQDKVSKPKASADNTVSAMAKSATDLSD